MTHTWRIPPIDPPVVQIDMDSAELGRSYPDTLGLTGDPKATLQKLIAAIGRLSRDSAYADRAAGSSLAYGATKVGVVSLTQNLARALGPEVRVNAIAPGAVDSPWMVEWSEEERRNTIDRAVLKRRCTPEDLAEVILFLGLGAAMVTGQTIVVDGGLTL